MLIHGIYHQIQSSVRPLDYPQELVIVSVLNRIDYDTK